MCNLLLVRYELLTIKSSLTIALLLYFVQETLHFHVSVVQLSSKLSETMLSIMNHSECTTEWKNNKSYTLAVFSQYKEPHYKFNVLLYNEKFIHWISIMETWMKPTRLMSVIYTLFVSKQLFVKQTKLNAAVLQGVHKMRWIIYICLCIGLKAEARGTIYLHYMVLLLIHWLIFYTGHYRNWGMSELPDNEVRHQWCWVYNFLYSTGQTNGCFPTTREPSY